MKRIFAVLLILALLAGCVPAIAEDDAEYVGTWIKRDTTYPVDLILEIFHLSEDHQAYYLYQAYYRGKPTTSLKYAGTWAQSGNGIDIILSNPAEVKYHATIGLQYAILEVTSEYSNISNSFIAVSNDMLSKLADEKLNAAPTAAPTEAPAVNGLKVPQGEYLVGKYIAPGDYRVTLVGEDLAVVWRYKAGNTIGTYYSLVYSKGETEAMIRLEEGDTLLVQHASVILSEMTFE